MVSRIPQIALLILILLANIRPDTLSQEQAGSASLPASEAVAEAESLYLEAVKLAESRYFDRAHLKLFEALKIWERTNHFERAVQSLIQIAEYDLKASRWQDALRCYRNALQFPPS